MARDFVRPGSLSKLLNVHRQSPVTKGNNKPTYWMWSSLFNRKLINTVEFVSIYTANITSSSEPRALMLLTVNNSRYS